MSKVAIYVGLALVAGTFVMVADGYLAKNCQVGGWMRSNVAMLCANRPALNLF